MAKVIMELPGVAPLHELQPALRELADKFDCDLRLSCQGVYKAIPRESKRHAVNNGDLRVLAQAYRRQNKGIIGDGGYVIFHEGEAVGWKHFLERPESQEPGCIAMDESGNQWIAAGGNTYNGALRWDPLPEKPKNVTRMPPRLREVRQPGPGAA